MDECFAVVLPRVRIQSREDRRDGGDKGELEQIKLGAGKEWRGGQFWTERGGWQGGRSAQLLFAMSLKEAADNTQVVASRDITRVGLQDDMHAVAEPEGMP